MIVTTIHRFANCNPYGNWGCEFAHSSKAGTVTGLIRYSPSFLFIKHTLSNRQYFNPATIRERPCIDPFFGKEMSKNPLMKFCGNDGEDKKRGVCLIFNFINSANLASCSVSFAA